MSEHDNIFKSPILKSDKVKEIKHWEMPNVGSGQKSTSIKTILPNDFEIEKRARMKMLESERKQGFNAGYLAGQEEGKEQGRKEFAASIARVEKLLMNLNENLSKIDELIEEHIIELVQVVAKKVIRKELSMSQKVVTLLVKESLKFLPKNTKSIKIHVHSDDKEVLEKELSKECLENIEKFELLIDDKIEPGGCVLQAESTFVDQTVSARMNDTLEALIVGYNQEDEQPSN